MIELPRLAEPAMSSMGAGHQGRSYCAGMMIEIGGAVTQNFLALRGVTAGGRSPWQNRQPSAGTWVRVFPGLETRRRADLKAVLTTPGECSQHGGETYLRRPCSCMIFEWRLRCMQNWDAGVLCQTRPIPMSVSQGAPNRPSQLQRGQTPGEAQPAGT